ncbi:MAG TPA: hypothetical protein VF872_01665, partial [Gaiellaceae bacterium]
MARAHRGCGNGGTRALVALRARRTAVLEGTDADEATAYREPEQPATSPAIDASTRSSSSTRSTP